MIVFGLQIVFGRSHFGEVAKPHQSRFHSLRIASRILEKNRFTGFGFHEEITPSSSRVPSLRITTAWISADFTRARPGPIIFGFIADIYPLGIEKELAGNSFLTGISQ